VKSCGCGRTFYIELVKLVLRVEIMLATSVLLLLNIVGTGFSADVDAEPKVIFSDNSVVPSEGFCYK